jgi:hypothetical protein
LNFKVEQFLALAKGSVCSVCTGIFFFKFETKMGFRGLPQVCVCGRCVECVCVGDCFYCAEFRQSRSRGARNRMCLPTAGAGACCSQSSRNKDCNGAARFGSAETWHTMTYHMHFVQSARQPSTSPMAAVQGAFWFPMFTASSVSMVLLNKVCVCAWVRGCVSCLDLMDANGH